MTNKNIKLAVYLVFLMVYLLPSGLIFGPFSAIHNHIFAVILAALYLLPTLKSGKMNKKTFCIWIGVFFIACYTRKFGFIDMIIIPIVDEFIKNKEKVKKIVLNSSIVYISIIFTIIYSLIYSNLGLGGRGEGSIGSGLLFTAIGEINLTGLSVFCLALLTRKKNKWLGNILIFLGMLTVSRSYLLALMCLLFFNINFVKKIINKLLKWLTYMNLTLLSSIAFICLGIILIDVFLNGGINEHSVTAGFSRLFSLNDFSNYFRFLAIYLVAKILINHPQKIILGISDDEYINYGHEICSAKGIQFTGIGPHNVFFSHLKIYGIAVLFEIYYVSKYLKKIITVDNFGIFFAIFCYCIILGTGFTNYWLFLSVITLIMYEK